VESSLGKTATDEIAVMVDTFRPLALGEAAFGCEDREYFRSWVEAPAKA
jgi:homogentisate 1,2-dioxygenase